MAIIYNDRKGGYAALRFSANTTQTLSSLNNDDTMLGARVTQVWWHSTGGVWSIVRGANTVFQGENSGFADFQSNGVKIELEGEEAADITVTNTGTDGTILLKVNKESDYDSEY